MKKFALISVSDKTGIVDFAKSLLKFDYEILATGNTAKLLTQNSVPVTEVSDLTGFPEIFEGRVKTLHPKVFGGILFRRDNPEDKNQANENSILPIDIVCVNLYPFVQTIKKENVSLDDVIENIDIGGPSLVRAAAKNYKYVSILTSPEQYKNFISELEKGNISDKTKEQLAVAAFSYTSNYDTHIANYLEQRFDLEKSHIRINEKLNRKLRYGENPHQSAKVFGNFDEYFEVFHGKEISYNNILDLVAAVELCEELGDNACAIIKHNNAAGAAIGAFPLDAYLKALKCDPVSAFGGIVAFNDEVDEKTAEKLNEIFLEIICAPSFSDEALAILKKKKDRRLVRKLKKINEPGLSARSIPGGILVQDKDLVTLNKDELQIVTNRKPTEKELEDLTFAWIVAKHTKSNAIVFAKDKATLGVGAGQMSRLDSAKIAYMKAKEHGLDLTNSVAASDAFFPFADGLLEIIKCGATAVIQPGGSVRDQEVIEAANQNNITMVFTGIRHFKH
ncbi:bifunctional phosphoribosylaminoimidazolecarboxamide formyltransferase/IMP cyclohydrolase [Ignavibacterium sp.]|uniref:bifunctional phosphoribosylaminoimidazolecarboxamide formyltransferase/IMP cyclohydrolase n=1 Tax=Ignavibacterium sp. TaxID=2651167 RepID=UPI00220999E1|nr:bifunctional phosphoribosylaminoimidazolecarboxamide formyltransferase/IMP cyclohydrolase [Ignavibacterium sp.]BDQ02202.1 MAG: bifunctional purine biosynthesis protein PurH [Ignavibacterium sp.]